MTSGLIDTNVSFGAWPWMDFSGVTPESLVGQLEKEGIAEAWVSATEAILYPDPDGPDDRLFATFRSCGRVVPVKTINLLLGNWRESLRRAICDQGLRLVKIHPNFHRYSLIDLPAMELAAALVEYGIPLLIQMRIEDERNQYPLLRVEATPVHEITAFAAVHPKLKVLVLGAQVGEIRALMAGAENVSCDISFAETGNTLESLLASIPAGRLMFGSHAPFFYTRAALMKLTGSHISKVDKESISRSNAAAFLPRLRRKSPWPDC